jgi:hypothetical protein
MQVLKILAAMKEMEGKKLLDRIEGSLTIPIVKQDIVPDEGFERAISQLSTFLYRPNVEKTKGATKKILEIINNLQDKFLKGCD